MQAFLVKVMIAVLMDPRVQAFLSKLLGDATAILSADIEAQVVTVEKNVLARIDQLPQQLLGNPAKDVGVLLHEITGTTNDIAGAVKTQVQPLLPTVDSIQSMFLNVLKGLPGGGILGGIFGK
jgi:hypothetical protein